jgi:peptidoglycan LD-endopeptidase LytH
MKCLSSAVAGATVLLVLTSAGMMSAAFAMMAVPTIKVSPIAGITVKDLHDSFNEMHHGHPHEAIDIVEPRGTPVHAVVDGTIKPIFRKRDE